MSNSIDMIKANIVCGKIPPIFVCERITNTRSSKKDRSGEKYLATPKLNPELEKKISGGITYKVTAKIDGTCCYIRDGLINKRYEVRPGKSIPSNWFQIQTNDANDISDIKDKTNTHDLLGFMPLDKNDKWHLDCHQRSPDKKTHDYSSVNVLDTNYEGSGLIYRVVKTDSLNGCSVEVIGPKFQSNPHKVKMHCVIKHGLIEVPKSIQKLSL